MFTGIVETVGKIVAIERHGADARLRVRADALDWSDTKPGDSIAVSGVCLTVTEFSGSVFGADASGETLSRTVLGELTSGARVNLERALLPTTRLGGHLVSGHVDGVGIVRERRADGRSIRFRIEAPAELAKYVAEKGSICVDGVSLTVNGVTAASFDVNIVPHTAAQTTMEEFKPGQRVNLEVDLLARYLERLLSGAHAAEAKTDISRDFLARHGFPT